MRNEELILKNLIHNEEYARKVLPFLVPEYFLDNSDRVIYGIVSSYFEKYNSIPNAESLNIILNNQVGVAEREFNDCIKLLQTITTECEKQNLDWLLSFSEKFCKDRAVLNAISLACNIIDGNEKHLSQDHIPELLTKALSISFDQDIGHDYFENAEDRYDFYHTLEERIPFDLDIFNKITKNGLPGKSLSVILASTGVGKSLFMCHMASQHAKLGKNVLYISLEMAEERIGERLDCNILNITFDELDNMDKPTFLAKLEKTKRRSPGKLILKEYPTSSASAAHFRALIEELKTKKNFVPDVIYIDYLGICASARYKNSANVNSYNYSKSVAEELRGLAMAYNVPIVTAVQVNRSGSNNSDPEWDSVAESHGIAMTADFFFALYASEEMQQLNQIMVKVMKNRWNSLDYYRRFLIGVDKSKMKLYNLEQPNMSPAMTDTKTDQNKKPTFDGWS